MSDVTWIDYLKQYNGVEEDLSYLPQEKQVRALMNITMPDHLSPEFYAWQDDYLKRQLSQKQIVDVNRLTYTNQMALYQGDITALKADAIVNACNEKLLGCFVPLHGCIDNAIHSAAGLEVRRDLLQVMRKQGHDEPNGQVKVTSGYNLPARYIFHTVGPIVQGYVTKENRQDLASSYLSCLKKADEMKLHDLVFCSLSTGIYGYPIEKAAEVAVGAVSDYLKESGSSLRVVFDVFSERDRKIYEERLRIGEEVDR